MKLLVWLQAQKGRAIAARSPGAVIHFYGNCSRFPWRYGLTGRMTLLSGILEILMLVSRVFQQPI